MFLQKLKLDLTKSYETTAEKENIVENLLLSYERVPLINVYTSQALPDEEIESQLGEKKRSIELSVDQYCKFKDRFDCTHILLMDYELFDTFGYKEDVFDKPLIVGGSHGFPKLQISRFHLNYERNDRFVAIYLLSQNFSLTIVAKHPNRIKIFCNIFRLDCPVCSYDDEIGRIETEAVVFVDGVKDVDCERIFVVGPKGCGLERLSFDLSLAGKFKYRILDVMRRVSPNTAKNIDQFDYTPFMNVGIE